MKKILSLMLTIAMLVTMCVFTSVSVSAAPTQWDGNAATAFSGGTGTKSDPYLISTAGELKLFADMVNGANGQTTALDICATLTADIVLNVGDVSGCNGAKSEDWVEWTPIRGTDMDYYCGSFSGAGHTVSGLYFNNVSESYVGLFGRTDTESSISNLGIVNSYIKAESHVGSVCGGNYMYSTITGCYNTGTVISTNSFVGGICGSNSGVVTDCYNTGLIDGNNTSGGICGTNYGTVSYCYNTGDVHLVMYFAGGICSRNLGTVESCYNAGEITGGYTINGGPYAGSVCGENNADYEAEEINCYFLDSCGNTDDSATSKSAAKVASGEVAWLLNGEKCTGDIHFYMADGQLTMDKTAYIARLQNGKYDFVKNKNTAVLYDVAPTYIVTIPEEVTLGSTATVKAENVIIEEGKQLEVALTATSGESNAFTVSNGNTATLTYTVANNSNTVSVGDTVLTVNPTNGSTGSTTLSFSKPEDSTIIYSGEYTGTVTFTVSLADEPLVFYLATDAYSEDTIALSCAPGTTWAEWAATPENIYSLQSYDTGDGYLMLVPDGDTVVSMETKALYSDVTWSEDSWSLHKGDFVPEDDVIRSCTYLLLPLKIMD